MSCEPSIEWFTFFNSDPIQKPSHEILNSCEFAITARSLLSEAVLAPQQHEVNLLTLWALKL